MFQKEKHLTNSEEDLMEIFWEKKEPLTSVEILELSAERSWNGNYIHKMLRSLLKKDMIKICGTVQCGTQYARQFIPAVTKEEYAAKLVMSKGIEKSSYCGGYSGYGAGDGWSRWRRCCETVGGYYRRAKGKRGGGKIICRLHFFLCLCP